MKCVLFFFYVLFNISYSFNNSVGNFYARMQNQTVSENKFVMEQDDRELIFKCLLDASSEKTAYYSQLIDLIKKEKILLNEEEVTHIAIINAMLNNDYHLQLLTEYCQGLNLRISKKTINEEITQHNEKIFFHNNSWRRKILSALEYFKKEKAFSKKQSINDLSKNKIFFYLRLNK